MEYFLLGLISGVVLSYIAIHLIARAAVRKLELALKELDNADRDQVPSIITARAEQHHGIFYLYSIADDSFIAQGASLDELSERIEQRKLGVEVKVTEGEPAVLQALRQMASALPQQNSDDSKSTQLGH